jgi:polyhydroxyalkanoate synthesis regulator phasin
MTIPTQDLCERLSHVEGMRRIGPLIAEARTTIEAQAAHIQKQALEYISLFDQCSEAQDRVKALEVKCALLAASLDQEEKRHAALEAGLTDGVTDDMAVLQSRVEELEVQLRERGEPVAWETEQKGFTKNAAIAKWWRDAGLSVIEYYAHPPAAAATFTCAARRQGSAGGNDPADCDWPTCGCDEHASKVIAALQESGHLKEPATAASEELLREIAALKRYDPNGVRGFAKSTLTVNVPKDLFERIDAAIAAQKERGE